MRRAGVLMLVAGCSGLPQGTYELRTTPVSSPCDLVAPRMSTLVIDGGAMTWNGHPVSGDVASGHVQFVHEDHTTIIVDSSTVDVYATWDYDLSGDSSGLDGTATTTRRFESSPQPSCLHDVESI